MREFTARGDLVYSTLCAKSLCVLEAPMQGTEALPAQTRWWDQFLHAWQAEHGVLPRQLVIYISGDLQCSPSKSSPTSLPCFCQASCDLNSVPGVVQAWPAGT